MKMKTAVIFAGLAMLSLQGGSTSVLAAHVRGARAQATPAEAGHAYPRTGPYPWCADYNNMTGNCGFESFSQCLEASRDNGGGCTPNPRYTPREGSPGAP